MMSKARVRAPEFRYANRLAGSIGMDSAYTVTRTDGCLKRLIVSGSTFVLWRLS